MKVVDFPRAARRGEVEASLRRMQRTLQQARRDLQRTSDPRAYFGLAADIGVMERWVVRLREKQELPALLTKDYVRLGTLCGRATDTICERYHRLTRHIDPLVPGAEKRLADLQAKRDGEVRDQLQVLNTANRRISEETQHLCVEAKAEAAACEVWRRAFLERRKQGSAALVELRSIKRDAAQRTIDPCLAECRRIHERQVGEDTGGGGTS